MTRYVIAAVLIIAVLYGLVEAWPLLAGPALSVASPANNETFSDGIVPIQGVALRAAELSLDGMPLLHDQDGSFSSTLTFPRGGSILTFVATDRFGKAVTATRSIFVP